MSALRQVIEAARSIGATVLMAQYNWRSELEGEREEGYHEIGRMAREMGIEPLQIGDAFAAAMREGRMPFLRDARHPNELGQRIMADVLDEPLRKAILARGG